MQRALVFMLHVRALARSRYMYVRLCSRCNMYVRLCSCCNMNTCACVHVACTCACVHVARTCACVQRCTYVQLVFSVARTCACVQRTHVRALVFMLHVRALVFMLHVRALVFMLHVRALVFMLHVRALVFMLHVRALVFMLHVRALVFMLHVRALVFMLHVRALVFMLHVRALVFMEEDEQIHLNSIQFIYLLIKKKIQNLLFPILQQDGVCCDVSPHQVVFDLLYLSHEHQHCVPTTHEPKVSDHCEQPNVNMSNHRWFANEVNEANVDTRTSHMLHYQTMMHSERTSIHPHLSN